LVSHKGDGVEIVYSMGSLRIEPFDVDGETMQVVSIPGALLPNDEGRPNLPGLGRYVALPQGATPRLEIVDVRTQILRDMNIAPAPPIPKESDDSPPVYIKDPVVYGNDQLYPTEPIRLSAPMKMRGVDVVIVGITPFQYNPVRRELLVYTDIRLRVDFEGGQGRFGEDRYRSRHWEPVLQANLINYGSLPEVDFSRRGQGKDTDHKDVGCEYIIIAPDDPDFIAWADTIRHWRTLQGISSQVYTLSQTGSSPSEIESFIDNAYNTWDIPPVAVLLLSDYPGSGKTYGIESPLWDSYCVSDNIYADVDGDDLPEINLARICAQDGGDLETMIEKFLDYEKNPYTSFGFYNNPVCAGGWQTSRWFILCSEVIYGFLANQLGKSPVREYAIYAGTPDTLWSTNVNTDMIVDYFGPDGLGYIPETPEHLTDWGGNATRLNNDINAGCFIVQHRDHGSLTGWGEPDYHNEDLDGLYNTMYPFVFSINCQTGRYDAGSESFTEKFHRIAYGALGLIAASQTSYSFVNDTFVWGMYDAMWPTFDPGYPGAAKNAGPDNLRPGFANASGKYYLEASNWPYNPQSKTVTYHLFHMHGDAFTTLYSEVPQYLSVDHPTVLYAGHSTFPVDADVGSVISLTVDGDIIGTADGTGSTVDVPIAPQSAPGTMLVTVTKYNHYRYAQSVPIQSHQGPWVVCPDGSGDFLTIQEAIDAAIDGDVVELCDATFTGQGNRDIEFHGKAITVRSQSGQPDACIINCQGSPTSPHRGFMFGSSEGPGSVLQDVTVQNGYVDGWGGGIVCYFSSPTIMGCRVVGNEAATDGGGITCYGGDPTIAECVITGNQAGDDGGGIWSDWMDSSPLIIRCTVSGNQSLGDGGGIAGVRDCSPSVENTIIWGNCAGGSGDEMYVGSGSSISLQCCDVDSTGLGGSGTINDVAHNLSADPLFCEPLSCASAPTTGGNYRLQTGSPCASGQQPQCGLIGALEEGCSTAPPYEPSNPVPAAGATGVSIGTDLCWTGGDPDVGQTVTYDAYFGTSSSPPYYDTTDPYPSSVTSICYDDLPLLETGMTYYWKIVAQDNLGSSTSGDLWYFTTGGNQQPDVPCDPFPADGATGVSRNPVLSAFVNDPDGEPMTVRFYQLDPGSHSFVTDSESQWQQGNFGDSTQTDGSGHLQLAEVISGFGDGSNGDKTVSYGTLLMMSDMNYRNLTIQSGATVDTRGHVLRVSETLTNDGTITDGYSGGSGGSGGAGGRGADPRMNSGGPEFQEPGDPGDPGGGPSVSQAGQGGDGGGGGGGAGGAWYGLNQVDADGGNGGDGGDGGDGGGYVKIFAYNFNNQGTIHADGEDGEDAASGTDGEYYYWVLKDLAGGGGGGGAGGSGGDGGTVEIHYFNLINQGQVHAYGGGSGGGGWGGDGDCLSYGVLSGGHNPGAVGAGEAGDGGDGEHRKNYCSQDGQDGGSGTVGAAGTTSLTSVSSGYVSSGQYVSKNFDAGQTADWESASIVKTTPSGTSVLAEYSPGAGWYADITDVPDSRFLRFRLTLSTSNSSLTPTVDRVTLNYRGAPSLICSRSSVPSGTRPACPWIGLAPYTTYYWNVTADDGHTPTVEGPMWSFTTHGSDNPPQPVDDLSIALPNHDITLLWTDPGDDGGVARYVVYRSTSPSSPGDSLTGTTLTEYTDQDVTGDPETNYYYTVKAVDAIGQKSGTSNMVGEIDRTLINQGQSR
jgi:hypothetical protein